MNYLNQNKNKNFLYYNPTFISFLIISIKLFIYQFYFSQMPLWPDERLYQDIIDNYHLDDFKNFHYKISILFQFYLTSFKDFSIILNIFIFFISLNYFFNSFKNFYYRKIILFLLILLIAFEPISLRTIMSNGYYIILISLILFFYSSFINKNIYLSIISLTLLANIWIVQYLVYLFLVTLIIIFFKKIIFHKFIILFIALQLLFFPQFYYNYLNFNQFNNANTAVAAASISVQNNDYSAKIIFENDFDNALTFSATEKYFINHIYENCVIDCQKDLKDKEKYSKKVIGEFKNFIFTDMYFKLSLKRLKYFLIHHYPDTDSFFKKIIYSFYYWINIILIIFLLFFIKINFRYILNYTPFIAYVFYVLAINIFIIYVFRYKSYLLFLLPFLIFQMLSYTNFNIKSLNRNC